MFAELEFEARAGLRGAGVAYARAAVRAAAVPGVDRGGGRGRRLDMELGYLLRPAGRRQAAAFARAHARACEALRREVVGALRGLRHEVRGLGEAGRNVYVSLFAVEPGAAAQEAHADAAERARGSYTTVIVPLTSGPGEGTTEFVTLSGDSRAPRAGRAYAFDGRSVHFGGANGSRAWRCALCVVVCKGSDPNRVAGGCRSWAGHF